VIEFTHAVLGRMPAARLRSGALFAEELAAPEGASPTEVFIAWTGRDPRWTAGDAGRPAPA